MHSLQAIAHQEPYVMHYTLPFDKSDIIFALFFFSKALECNIARNPSIVARNLLKLMPNSQTTRITCGHSIVSSAYNTTKALEQNRRQRQLESSIMSGIVGNASTQLHTNDDDLMKIDRILYNLYGDVGSIIRRVKLYNETLVSDNATHFTVRQTQNDSIQHFFADFTQQQPDGLMEAFARLQLNSNRTSDRTTSTDLDSRINDHLDDPRLGSLLNDSRLKFSHLNASSRQRDGARKSNHLDKAKLDSVYNELNLNNEFDVVMNDATNIDQARIDDDNDASLVSFSRIGGDFNISRVEHNFIQSQQNDETVNTNNPNEVENDEDSRAGGSTQGSSVYSIQRIPPIRYSDILERQRNAMVVLSQHNPEASDQVKASDIRERVRFGSCAPKTPESNRKFHFDVDNLFSPEPEKNDNSTSTSIIVDNNKYLNDIEMFETPSGLFGNTHEMSASEILFNEAHTSTLFTSKPDDVAIFSGESLLSFEANSKQKIPDQFTETSRMDATSKTDFSLSLVEHTMEPMPVPEFDEFQLSFTSNRVELPQFSGFKTPSSDTNQNKSFNLFSNFTQQSWNCQSDLSKPLDDVETSSHTSDKKQLQFERLNDFSSSGQFICNSKRGTFRRNF